MTGYTLALFVHILGVIALAMATGFELLCLRLLVSARKVEQLQERSNLGKVSERLFPLGSLLVLGSGVYMVLTSWSWTTAWVAVGFVALLVGGAVGSLVNGKRLQAIGMAAGAAQPGPVPAALYYQVHDPVLRTSVQSMAGMMLGIVFLMVAKPDLVGSLVAIVVSVALGAASAYLVGRRGSPRPASESRARLAATRES